MGDIGEIDMRIVYEILDFLTFMVMFFGACFLIAALLIQAQVSDLILPGLIILLGGLYAWWRKPRRNGNI